MKKRASFNGKNQDREIFPGVSDKAFESWDEVIRMWDGNTAMHKESIHGFKLLRDVLIGVNSDFDPESGQPLVGAERFVLKDLITRFVSRAFDSTWQMQRDVDDIPILVSDPIKAQLQAALALVSPTPGQSGAPSYADLNLPEWFLRVPAPSNPWDQINTASSYQQNWLTGSNSRQTSLQAHNQITSYLMTGRPTDFLQAFDTAATLLKSLQTDMDNQLRSWRAGNKSAVIPRRIAQLGFEIKSLEEFIQEYFGDDTTIAKILETRARTEYGDGIRASNKARERAERIASGELRVGGKLTAESLAPKPGIVRSSQELEKLLLQHKTPPLIENASSTKPDAAITPLTQDEVDFYDQVQNAFLTKILPNGQTVEEYGASGSTSDSSIAELHMSLELNGYNDAPLQLSDEEFENALKEKDDEGNPLWHFMSRFLDKNDKRKDLTPDMMVEEYRQAERWPIGGGGQAGGRGDNFQGGSGLTYYGPAGIGALVSSKARVADRQWLDDISDMIKDVLRDASSRRHVEISPSIMSIGTKVDDDELMELIDNLKIAMITNSSYSSFSGLTTGDPRYDEAMSIASMAIEHWLQIELSKISVPEGGLSEDDEEWNARLLRMQQNIFNMDEAQVAIYAGYDGYFTNRPPWARSKDYKNEDWYKNTDKNMNSQQIMWLNRTALAVLHRTMTHADAARFSRA